MDPARNAFIRELRSDTFSLPSPEMYDALRSAPLGDDVYNEDPTVERLQRRAADLTGKQAALLVTSGTQGNLAALLAQTRPGDEAICGRDSDLYNYEMGGLSAVGGLFPRTVDDSAGVPALDDVRRAIRAGMDIHHGQTRVLALENSHQRAGGRPIEPDAIGQLADLAHEHGFRVHLDGARLFNAAVALGVDAREITRDVDSVTFCLSKGLSCPVGSVLCGSEGMIERAKQARKMLGGGMRQAGWIAIAGIVALENIDRLRDDHRNAKTLAEALADLPEIEIDPGMLHKTAVNRRATGPTRPCLVGPGRSPVGSSLARSASQRASESPQALARMTGHVDAARWPGNRRGSSDGRALDGALGDDRARRLLGRDGLPLSGPTSPTSWPSTRPQRPPRKPCEESAAHTSRMLHTFTRTRTRGPVRRPPDRSPARALEPASGEPH